LQNEGLSNLYVVLNDYIPKAVYTSKNKAKSWSYGYNEKYDLIIISKDGTLGEVVSIQGLIIGLPKAPDNYYKRHDKPENSIGRGKSFQKNWQGYNLYFNGTISHLHLRING
jgi:hypothetical protein